MRYRDERREVLKMLSSGVLAYASAPPLRLAAELARLDENEFFDLIEADLEPGFQTLGPRRKLPRWSDIPAKDRPAIVWEEGVFPSTIAILVQKVLKRSSWSMGRAFAPSAPSWLARDPAMRASYKVLVPGSALTMEVPAFRRALRQRPKLCTACEAHTRSLFVQMLQAVPCTSSAFQEGCSPGREA
jgi:hypothetical protein